MSTNPGNSARPVERSRIRLHTGSGVRAARAAAVAAALFGGAAFGGVLLNGGAAAAAAPASTAPSARTAASTPPFEVIQEFPTAPDANGAAAIQIHFSGVLPANGVRPTISPQVPGTWVVARNELVFRPRGAFPPDTIVTVTVPAGPGGIRSIAGRELAHRSVWKYETGAGSVLHAEQVLAELGYLPVHFTPEVAAAPTLYQSQREVFVPAAGSFSWTWDAPATLRQLWTPARPGQMLEGALKGALMSFQTQHDLPVTGTLDAQVWSALTTASRHRALWRDRTGYTYALANQSEPESLTVWHDGRVLLVSPANTGGSESPTENGTFPVYERLASQIMRGVNPDGTPYADPVAWVAYFNGGDAVHYMPRADYGSPQSLGCVELPYSAAAEAWPDLTIGSLVTVEA